MRVDAGITCSPIAIVYVQRVLRPSRNKDAGVIAVLVEELSRAWTGVNILVIARLDKSICVGMRLDRVTRAYSYV